MTDERSRPHRKVEAAPTNPPRFTSDSTVAVHILGSFSRIVGGGRP